MHSDLIPFQPETYLIWIIIAHYAKLTLSKGYSIIHRFIHSFVHPLIMCYIFVDALHIMAACGIPWCCTHQFSIQIKNEKIKNSSGYSIIHRFIHSFVHPLIMCYIFVDALHIMAACGIPWCCTHQFSIQIKNEKIKNSSGRVFHWFWAVLWFQWYGL